MLIKFNISITYEDRSSNPKHYPNTQEGEMKNNNPRTHKFTLINSFSQYSGTKFERHQADYDLHHDKFKANGERSNKKQIIGFDAVS